MGKFVVIPQDTFNDLQLDAGVLLTSFDPDNPVAPADSAIVCATTGGINVTCTPTYSDFGEDVDNCPNNTKELKHLDGWEVGLSTTALGVTPEMIKMALGAADMSTADVYEASADTSVVAGKTYYTRSGSSPNYTYTPVASPTGNPSTSSYYEKVRLKGQVTPRVSLSQDDFTDAIWWVGDRADGGMVAVKLINALSTSGFALQTTKNGKGQLTLELGGHVSINAQDVVPMVFYTAEPVA